MKTGKSPDSTGTTSKDMGYVFNASPLSSTILIQQCAFYSIVFTIPHDSMGGIEWYKPLTIVEVYGINFRHVWPTMVPKKVQCVRRPRCAALTHGLHVSTSGQGGLNVAVDEWFECQPIHQWIGLRKYRVETINVFINVYHYI